MHKINGSQISLNTSQQMGEMELMNKEVPL